MTVSFQKGFYVDNVNPGVLSDYFPLFRTQCIMPSFRKISQ